LIASRVIKNETTASANLYLLEEKKGMISETLKTNIEQLKKARKEIHKAILLALAMEEAGDDIANQVIVAVVEAFCY